MFGFVAFQPTSIGTLESSVGLLPETLLYPVPTVFQFELNVYNGARPVAVILKRADWFRVRAIALKEDRVDGVEQRGFAHFVRANEDVEAVTNPIETGGLCEFAELVDGDRAEFHRWAAASF